MDDAARPSPRRQRDLVAIGAFAGGVEALKTVVSARSYLADILARLAVRAADPQRRAARAHLEVDRVNGFLQRILAGLELAVVVVDADHRVQLWNGGAERLTGVRAFEAEGRRLLELDLHLHLHLHAAPVRAVLRSVVVAGELPGPVDVDLTERFGRVRRRRLTATPLVRAEGEVHGAVVTLADAPTDRELQGADHSA